MENFLHLLYVVVGARQLMLALLDCCRGLLVAGIVAEALLFVLGCFVTLVVYLFTVLYLCFGPNLASDFAVEENSYQSCCFIAVTVLSLP